MWLRSVYLKTIREARVAVLGWGVGMGLMVFVVEASVASVVHVQGGARALAGITESFRWAAEPVAVTTVGGYTTWKLAFTVLILAIWPLIAASRALRGAEERGTMDVLLSLPRSRLRVALESLAGVWSSLLAMTLLVAIIAYLGGVSAHAGFGLGDALLFGLNLALASGVFGSIALLVSQFTQQARAASGAAGGLLFFFIVLDMVHRIVPGTAWLSALSPVYYFNLSKPLVPGYGVDPWAMLLLLALSVVLSAAGVALFVRRDIALRATLPGKAGARPAAPSARAARRAQAARSLPERDWSLRSLYARALAMVVAPGLWWTAGMAAFASFMIVAAKAIAGQLQALIQGSSVIGTVVAQLGGGAARMNDALLNALFFFLPLVIMIFAVTETGRWAADEEDGRQELILAAPRPRHHVLLARFAALATAAVFMALVTLAAAALTAAAAGLPVDGPKLTAAVLSIVPQGLLMAAIGYLLAGWLAAALETGLLSFLLAFWFLISFVGPELHWPPAVLKLSAFTYYGAPLVRGVAVGDTLIVLGVTAVALVGAALRFLRKDIGRFWR
ncbi:MAG TPA: ABC transporter permease subunit [Trueperaceae bacterium]|nr:ABC transporter permease subunit [Trueperaceae bacterium]